MNEKVCPALDPPADTEPDRGIAQFQAPPMNRRGFIRGGTGTTLAAVTGVLGLPPMLLATSSAAEASELGPFNPAQRSAAAYAIRHKAALQQKALAVIAHPDNGDELAYPTRIGNFTKGLPHDNDGLVVPAAYDKLLSALSQGSQSALDNVPLGGARKLVNPLCGLAFDLEGTDSHKFPFPPPPAFASAEAAAEMVELYWHALLRDVPFDEYPTNALAEEAAADLSTLPDFKGPRDQNGDVTADTLFRADVPGALEGPYLSQFFLLPVPFGANDIEQRVRPPVSGLDYLTQYADWLASQNGAAPPAQNMFQSLYRYMQNGRDLAQWVHVDVLFQAYFTACLILFAIGAPPNPGNPYTGSVTQTGFGTFGPPEFITLLCEVSTRALKAIWFQKWFVQRRLRPEAYGARVHQALALDMPFPLHPDVLGSNAIELIHDQYSSYLLPQAYPEGCPLHPAYGAGHATVAGACVTLLKALFDENYVIPNPVVVNPDDPGTLHDYDGVLTVGGELNKLAGNVAIGRDFAGIHWRSDTTASFELGERVAISILQDQHHNYFEDFAGFTFTRFDGSSITV